MKTLLFIVFVFTVSVYAQEETCSQDGCHAKLIEHEFQHPAIEEGCESCHDGSVDNHPNAKGNEFELTEEVPELCFECHDAPDEKLNIHGAVEAGECLTCHSPHATDYEFVLKEENPGDLCFECHDIDEGNDIFKHGPVISRQCLACHQPHESENEFLLRDTPPDLCYMCHSDKKEKLNYATVHPAYEGVCTDCHKPHNATVNHLLNKKMPELCFECHDDKQEEMAEAKTVHGVINVDESCGSCHDPHATQTPTLLRAEGSELCFQCHDKTYKSDDRKIKNIKQIVTNAEYPHPPVEDGECTECHSPHYSSNSYLLAGNFPFSNYIEEPSSEKFQLCFDCHDSDKLDKKTTTEATNFRDGKENLHYFHISKNKGRNCTMCHEVHGSPKPHLIAKKVKFGQWKMPLNYKEKDNGGSCLPGCHATKEYSRKK